MSAGVCQVSNYCRYESKQVLIRRPLLFVFQMEPVAKVTNVVNEVGLL